MIQLIDLLSIKEKQTVINNVLGTGKEVTFYLGGRKVTGIISYLDCKWKQERRLYAQPTVDINISLIDIQIDSKKVTTL